MVVQLPLTGAAGGSGGGRVLRLEANGERKQEVCSPKLQKHPRMYPKTRRRSFVLDGL